MEVCYLWKGTFPKISTVPLKSTSETPLSKGNFVFSISDFQTKKDQKPIYTGTVEENGKVPQEKKEYKIPFDLIKESVLVYIEKKENKSCSVQQIIEDFALHYGDEYILDIEQIIEKGKREGEFFEPRSGYIQKL